MYIASKVVYIASDRCFLNGVIAKKSGLETTLKLIPIYEKYPIGEKHKATRRKLY